MLRLVGWWWVLAATALGLTGCANLEPVRQEVPVGAQDLMYDEEVTTLADLVDTSDAVVLARPLAGDEQILLDVDGVQVLGRQFRVLRSFSGTLGEGEEIVVARPRYGVSPDMEQRLNDRGMTATLPPDEATDNPPFERPLYVLGLDYTGQDYPVAAWTPANGPHSRIPFSSAAGGAMAADVEVVDTPLQERLAGTPLRQVLQQLRDD